MPNWTLNSLAFKAEADKKQTILDFLRNKETGNPIDFNNITPMPPWVHQGGVGPEEEEKYGAENCWYDWSLDHWGTKWNARNIQPIEEMDDNRVEIKFDTAWSPVSDLIQKLSWIFPDVTFSYYYLDEFGEFENELVIQDGKVSVV